MNVYLATKVRITDEFGIWDKDWESATAFFTLVQAWYERDGIILTFNKSFAERGELLGDTVSASIILDRPLHHSHVINIQGESSCIKDNRQAGLFPSDRYMTSTPEEPGSAGTTHRADGQ